MKTAKYALKDLLGSLPVVPELDYNLRRKGSFSGGFRMEHLRYRDCYSYLTVR